LAGVLDTLPMLEDGTDALIQMPDSESMSPLPSPSSKSISIQTPYESLGSVGDSVFTSLVHGTPIQNTPQAISHFVNEYHIGQPVVLLVLSMILYYVFVVVQVEEEIVV
jgi:hypothetical protein